MDEKTFTDLTSKSMVTHMKKPEMISIMRALALKYSELGQYKDAMQRIDRAKIKIKEFYEESVNT